MLCRVAFALVLGAAAPTSALAQDVVTYKSAVVALAEDPAFRAEFEEGLVEKALEHDYDAVTSYDLVPDVTDIDNKRFLRVLASDGVRMVLMVRPAAVGPGASLESVRDEVSPELLADMRRFAKDASSSDGDDLIAVVHMAIYEISEDDAVLVSSGAVWLDEDVATPAEGNERLQDLIVANVDAVRPKIRSLLGLPRLERPAGDRSSDRGR
ncbi:MAG TPA: hypothetical protein VF339_04295 [Gammaproteobacteria bacterium]